MNKIILAKHVAMRCPYYATLAEQKDISQSILPSMSKIFEREMVNQLSTFFESILSQFISGIRTKHSCETVLLYMIENIKNYIDNGKFVCMVIVDLSRAFDCIPYKLFISKLHVYGLSISACQLLFSYYLHRKQRVKLGKNVSCWKDILRFSPGIDNWAPVI